MIMQKWLYDRPWIWIVVLLTLLVGGGMTTLVIAELNRPEIVKEDRDAQLLAPFAINGELPA